MVLGTTYIFASDINKSIDFYSKLLQEQPLWTNDDRWVQFSNKIALYNKAYDVQIIGQNSSERFNQAYIDDFYKDVGEVSELMYVNVHMPYWYFNIIDPDGNTLEITGGLNG